MAVAPIIPLQLVQMGIESVRGTGVPATTILDMDAGGAALVRTPSIIRIRNSGSLATSHRSYPGNDVIQVDVAGTWTYNWAPNWFNLFLGPLATGTGASADKTWTFGSAVVSDSADNLTSATLEVGGRDTWPSEYQVKGCVGLKLELSIKAGAAWTYKASLLGQAVTPQAKTGSLTTAAGIVDVLGTTTKVYIDSASAFGTTQKVGTVLSADITIDLGAQARYTLDAARTPTRVGIVGPRKVAAKVIAEYAAQTEYTAAHAGTAQRLRIAATGPTLGSSAYACTVDIPGTYETFTIGKDGDVVTEELHLTAQYDSTPAADINASVVNASASLL